MIPRRTRRSLALAVAALAAAAAACGGGSHGGGGVPQGPIGGTVTLQYSSSSPYALAVFVSSAGEFAAPPRDGCLTTSTAGSPVGMRYLDGGATLTFTGGGKTVTLDRFGGPSPSYLYYSASPAPSQIALDASYDASLSGGPDIPATTWPGVLAMRHPISLGSTLPVPASGDLALSWTPAGADFVRIDFYDGFTPPAKFSCWAADDGHFSIPATLLATLPAGSGGVLAAATKRTLVLVDGRVVAFDGEASSGATWTK